MRISPVLLLAAALTVGAGCDTVSDRIDGAACAASGYADTGEVAATVGDARYATPCVRVQTEAGQVTVASIDKVVSNGDQRLLAVTAPTQVGTFSIGSSRAAGAYTLRADDSRQQAEQVYAAVSGSVTVTAVSEDAAEGTFSFTARTAAGDEIEVTAGRFDVSF